MRLFIRRLTAIFYFEAKKKTKILYGIDLDFYEIEQRGRLYRVVCCYDADLFSESVLKSLFLGDGRAVDRVLAFSLNDGILKLKMLSSAFDIALD